MLKVRLIARETLSETGGLIRKETEGIRNAKPKEVGEIDYDQSDNCSRIQEMFSLHHERLFC